MTSTDRAFLGADIGGTHLRTALVDPRGTVIARRKTATAIRLGADHTFERLSEECGALIDRAHHFGRSVAAIGLGVAGKIDCTGGRVLFSPNLPAMADYPLASKLEARLGLPVVLENDANAFGIGENWIGAGIGIENWIGITLGTGVGGCLILNGRLWQGDRLGFVGEVGHMVLRQNGPRCACGLEGCLEAFASGSALVSGVLSAISEGVVCEGPLYEAWAAGTLSAQTVFERARAGERAAAALFDRMGWALGLALANLFTALGIRHAIFGGGVSAGWELFIGPLHRTLDEHSSMLGRGQAVILRGVLGDDAALLGAARLAMEGGR